MKNKFDKNYWTERYDNDQTGWDLGMVSPALKTYFDQLEDKSIKILIPGGGNSYEAEYLFNNGFKNVFVVDVAEAPLENIKKRVPNFPSNQLILGDFFNLNDSYDLIIEQTFFCAINPALRMDYVTKMRELLKTDGKLVGLLFNVPLNTDHPPFGGNKGIYKALFFDYFIFDTFEPSKHSISERKGKELFINFRKLKR